MNKASQLLLTTSLALSSLTLGVGVGGLLLTPTTSEASPPAPAQIATQIRVDNNVEQVTVRDISIEGSTYRVTTKAIAGVDRSLLLNPERYQVESDVANRTTYVRVAVPQSQLLDVLVVSAEGEGPHLNQAITQALRLARAEALNSNLLSKANEAAVKEVQESALSGVKILYPDWTYKVTSTGVFP